MSDTDPTPMYKGALTLSMVRLPFLSPSEQSRA